MVRHWKRERSAFKDSGCAICRLHLPTLRPEPVLSEEQNCCDSWTVGVGATRTSKIESDMMKGRVPSPAQLEVTILS